MSTTRSFFSLLKTDERGILMDTLVNGKGKYPGSSSSFASLQQQLEQAQRQIEDQATLTKVAAEQQLKIENLTLVEKYLRQTDHTVLDFIAAHSTANPSASDP